MGIGWARSGEAASAFRCLTPSLLHLALIASSRPYCLSTLVHCRPFFVHREAERHVACDVEFVHPHQEDAAMDDRTVGDRGNANEAQRGPISAGDDEGSRNGRRGTAGGVASFDPRSATNKPPLTERERGERWPLG